MPPTNRPISRGILSVAFAVFLLGGCTSSPSEATGRKAFEASIAKSAAGLAKVVSFQKVNGQESDLMGVKVYSMEYKAEVEFSADCRWGIGNRGNIVATTSNNSMELMSVMIGVQGGGLKSVKKGQRETVTGALQFEKTEKGWRGPDGGIY